MPLLEETGYIPTEKYAKAPELLAQCRRIGEKFGLYDRAVFHTEVTAMTWDDAASRWVVETDRGDKIRARFAASASGPLNMPKLPGVEGIESFKGHSFHTSRWDYAYTGGDGYGKMFNLGDKRVGFIGTGATAIQSVPHLGEGVQSGENGRLYVFQRTPSSVARRDNRPTDPEWAASLQPGWQAARQENFLRVMGGSQEEDMVRDGWTTFSRWMKEQGLPRSPNLWKEYGELLELADHQNMERIRARCDDVVKDQATADGLKPWYRTFCKRPTFNDEYLDTFNLPNVTLVDTDGKGVERITEKGIVANGREYELDCIVFGTGFEVGTSFSRRANYETYGRGGLTMTEKWAEGVRTLYGYHMHDFPNLFIISTLQSGYAANFVHMLGRQAKHVAWLVAEAEKKGVKTIEATREAEDAWGDVIIANQRRNAGFQKECTPGYYNLEGQLNDSIAWQRSSSYGLGPLAFCKLMEEWREKGDFEGLHFTYLEEQAEKAAAGEATTNGVNGHVDAAVETQQNGVANGDRAPVVEQPAKEPVVAPIVEEPVAAPAVVEPVNVANGSNGVVEHAPAPIVDAVEDKAKLVATVAEVAPVVNGAVNGHVNGHVNGAETVA
jgi:cyclohexanone monooxygenase